MLYFAISIFVSAFLLFQIQPLIAKYILPWFGGTPSVWSTVMLFFQVLLTGGYAYANWLIQMQHRSNQSLLRVHLTLLGTSLLLICIFAFLWPSPITPPVEWRPYHPNIPIVEIFKLLSISVGLAYFLLSTNSPLMQAWYSRTHPKKSPYILYALSNLGSLLGLITFPILIEPFLTLSGQGWWWSTGYVTYAFLAIYGVLRMLRQPLYLPVENTAVTSTPAPNIRQYLMWLLLSAVPSIMLLATTNQLTQEVAVIPFLWVLPLTMYLLSYIFAFSGERWYPRQTTLIAFFCISMLFLFTLLTGNRHGVPFQVSVYTLTLFLSCLICNGELYRQRPPSEYLTSFYLMISIGGALGGIFVNFIAPELFTGYWELPLGFVLCWILLIMQWFPYPLGKPSRTWLVFNRMLLFSGLYIAAFFSSLYIRSHTTGNLYAERNYYGVVRVRSSEQIVNDVNQALFSMVHGVTVHGSQFKSSSLKHTPTSYYTPGGGAGLAIENHPRRGQGMRVGILGEGIGTLATYGQTGDVYRFYEINPAIIELAAGQGNFFTYLSDSKANIEVIANDARISLEEELLMGTPQQYDVLIIDTFSSDSIPVHLLNKEAFEIYLQHLQSDGILALHITNQFLNLVPVIWKLADHFQLEYVLLDTNGSGPGASRAIWMLLSRQATMFELQAIQENATSLTGYTTDLPLWTDNYSNIFQILR